MAFSHNRDAKQEYSRSAYALLTRGMVGLVVMTFLTSCASDQLHKTALKQTKEGPIEEGVAKLQNSSSNHPENREYRVDYLRERERVVNQLLLDAAREQGKGDLNKVEAIYQQVLRLDPENAQAELGLKELVRSRQHAVAIIAARDALDSADYKAAYNALQQVLIENPKDPEAQDLNRQIDAARLAGGSLNQIPELGAAYKKPVSLQFRDTNLKMIFEAISRTSGLNILFDKDIKSDLKATVFVKQATVEDTINLILMQNQLEKKVLNDSTLYIYPATAAKLKEHQDLVIRTFQLTNADAKQMLILLKTVIKAKDLFVNEKTNSIVMRDTPDVVALAAKLIAAQDVNEPEVMLEMEVLEVTHNLATELGVKYPDQVSIAVGNTIQTLQDWKGINKSQINVTAGTGNILGVTLNLKKTDGDVNTLANPRIRVRQNEKAKIHIGQRYPIITNTVTPSTGTPVVTGSIQYIELGLKLEVEPNIHMDGEVGIKTSLEVSSLGGNVTSGTQAAPIVNSRTVSTVLRLKDGETQILAGLINDEDRNGSVKVPGLGDIPLLGRLFSSHTQDKNKTELILAITPHIVRNIHQPDVDLAAYWSGTDATARSRPITVEKMGTMKLDSSGAGFSVNATASPLQRPLVQPIVVPASGDTEGPVATPSVIKPTVMPSSDGTKPRGNPATLLTPEVKASGVASQTATHGTVPASGTAGMSDAAVVQP
jgi:general secretion pathway protein D